MGVGVHIESPFPKPERFLPIAKEVAEGAVPLDLLEIRAWGLNPRGLGVGNRQRAEGLGPTYAALKRVR